jgi:hypothetical protein
MTMTRGKVSAAAFSEIDQILLCRLQPSSDLSHVNGLQIWSCRASLMDMSCFDFQVSCLLVIWPVLVDCRYIYVLVGKYL